MVSLKCWTPLLHMADVFSYYEGDIRDFIQEALSTNSFIKRFLGNASSVLVKDLKLKGLAIDESYGHTIDNCAVRHVLKVHGSSNEHLRGQIPITDNDIMLIPQILASYDSISLTKNRRMQDIIIYSKAMDDGITIYIEEVRQGRNELATSTMYKKKKEDSPTLIE